MGSFLTERLQSLVSKKLGAAVLGEGVVAVGAPDLAGQPTLVFIVVQGLVDAVKYYTDKKFGSSKSEG
jgi:ABC-type thiamin/hydroxymethylpyrimidine transport system permease subunit